MNKYLFADGTRVVKEVQSTEELQTLVESAEYPDTIRIWVYSSNEWISYASFRKKYSLVFNTEKTVVNSIVSQATSNRQPVTSFHWLKKFLIISAGAVGVFLIFNFTKIKWTKAAPLIATAARPANVPVMDIDSLIMTIEDDRGVLLDRSTRNNLRIRNTWPDKIELRLNAERETSSAGSRYYNVDVSIDNTTGFNLDEAIVKFSLWKNGKKSSADTMRFNNISYGRVSARQLHDSYRSDSLSVSFESIKAKAFNFCYSATIKNNSGNYNDRWFCRESNKP